MPDSAAPAPTGVARLAVESREIGERICATLSNGLRLVIQDMPGTDVVALRCYIGGGSMLEGEELGCGISHFCEHLLAGGGTTLATEDDYRKVLDRIGGQENAYTTTDHTCYHIVTTRPHADTAVRLTSEWMQHASIEPAAFEREKNVIIREVEKGETEPGHVFHRLFATTACRVHPWRVPVIGFPELVRGVTRERMMAFRDRHYHPANTVLTIAGGVDPHAMLRQVAGCFGEWARRAQPPISLPTEPEQLAPRLVLETSSLLHGETAWLKMAWPTVPLDHPDLYPLDVLSVILGHGDGARMVRSLRDEQRVVTSMATSSWTPSWGRGMFSVTAFTTGAKLAPARDAILRELARCTTELPSMAELERARTRKLASEVFSRQRAEDVAASLGYNLMALGDPDFDDAYLAGIQRVTQADVREAARRYFSPQKLTTVAMVSQEAYDADAKREQMLPPPASSLSVAIGSGKPAAARNRNTQPVLHTLGNGLRIVVQPMPGTGTVTIQSFSHGGLRHETPQTNGRFHAMARTFVRGTPSRDARAVTDAFDSIGGTMGGGAGNHTVGLAARFLAGDQRLGKGLEVFCDVLRHAAFPDHEVARALERQKLMVQRQDESWQHETMRRLRQQMFGDHPYGMTLTGTEESIDAITPAALRELHAAWCTPDRSIISMVGDIDADAAVAAATRWLEDWPCGAGFQPASGPQMPSAPKAVPPDAPRHMPFPTGKNMAAIAMAWAAPAWGSADAPVLDVIDAVTSGVHLPAGWLHNALRGGTNDYVYYVHAVPFAGLDGGMFYALTQCHPSQREEVLGIMRRELGRLHTELVSDEELDAARHTCRIARAIENQTNDARAAELALDVLYDKGLGWSDGYAERVELVTAADIRRVADEWFRDEVLVEAIPVGELPTGE